MNKALINYEIAQVAELHQRQFDFVFDSLFGQTVRYQPLSGQPMSDCCAARVTSIKDYDVCCRCLHPCALE